MSGIKFAMVVIEEYWNTHSILEVPSELSETTIMDLRNGRVISNNEINEKMDDMYKSPLQEIKIIKPELSEYDIIALNAIISDQVEFKYIVKDKIQLKYKIKKILRDIGWEKNVTKEYIKRKMSKRIPILIMFNEREGMINFPDKRGKLDTTTCIYGSDASFLNWIRKYFDFIWKNSEEFLQDKVPEVYNCIHNENARGMLSLIKNSPEMRPTDMADYLDITNTEIVRWKTNILSSGLAYRDSNNYLQLTSFGELVCDSTTTVSYLARKAHYFQDHSIADLPNLFRLSIGALSKSELIDGAPLVKHKWNEIYRNAYKYNNKAIKAIKPEVEIKTIEISHEEIMFRDVKYIYILPENVISPPDREEVLDRLKWRDMISQGKIERKMLEGVTIAMVLNEGESMISFPNTNGASDLTKGLYSTDPIFVEWCRELFEFIWKNADVFDEKKINNLNT